MPFDVRRELVARHGSVENAAVLAIEHPDYAEDFARLGAEIEEPDTTEWTTPAVISLPDEPGTPRSVYVPETSMAAFRDLVVEVTLPMDVQPAAGTARTGRPPGLLPVTTVARIEARLRERQAVVEAGDRPTGPLALEAIATHAGVTRYRAEQIEELMRLGWPLRKTHPEFSAEEGFVRLPSTADAARLLRSR